MSEQKIINTPESGKALPTTIAYRQFKNYYDNFLVRNGILQALEERRRFFRGDQYAPGTSVKAPRPIMNLVQEGVVKVTNKCAGTKRHISFIADKENKALDDIDNFYDYQCKKMKREVTIYDLCENALIDGTGVIWTSFDKDTIGTEGIYKGFLKDHLAPFETNFFSNPWTTDPQENRYCGFYIDMEVGAAKELIEGDEKTKEEKAKYIASEEYFAGSAPYDFGKITDSDLTRVYFRFFRENGEVYFEVSTEYVVLTDHPHALSPSVNEEAKKWREQINKVEKKANEVEAKADKAVLDYDTDESKYTVFTDAEKESHSAHMSGKRKFSRYPVSLCIPFPERPYPCVLGRSFAGFIIPNQKIINYCYLLAVLIMQYHAMPKWIAKPGALGNQIIDNSPNQVLYDYSKVQDVGGNGFGLTRMASGEAVNSNLIEIADTIANNTRFILGFANLEASGTSIDSGFEYQQRIKQINLPLESVQQHLWDCCADLAKTDIMYFTHYIDNAKFYTVRSESELSLNENYRAMEQNLINNGKSQLPKGTMLPKSKRYEMRSIDRSFFDADFDVVIEVEQGIAGSELTESQHINQIWGYIAQGNLTADKIKMLISADPAISRKTRAKFNDALEELETSQLAMKDQQIEALNQAVAELQNYAKFTQQVINFQQKKQKATEQAAMDQNRVAASLLKSKDEQMAKAAGPAMSESEVKAMNAKGISGGSFAGGGNETIYNTGN